MNYQKLFEDNYRAFIIKKVSFSYDQNRKGIKCVYRGRINGKITKCGIGRFIPNKLYRPAIEGSSAIHILTTCRRIADHMKYTGSEEDLRFIRDLQHCHDLAARSTEDPVVRIRIAKKFYKEMATAFNLKIPVK